MNVRSSLREILHFGRPAEVCQFEWGYDHHVPPEVSYEDFLKAISYPSGEGTIKHPKGEP
jgi:hypothetical protein